MKRILFVCTGNTCRSPMAAALMRRLLEKRHAAGVVCESAGLAARPGQPASKNAVAAMRELGVDLSGHRARGVSRELVGRSDAVVVMSAAHAAMLTARFPGAAGKIRVLGGGIPDPYGGDMAAYRRCRDAMAAALRAEADRWA